MNAEEVLEMFLEDGCADRQGRRADRQALLVLLVLLGIAIAMILCFIVGRGY